MQQAAAFRVIRILQSSRVYRVVVRVSVVDRSRRTIILGIVSAFPRKQGTSSAYSLAVLMYGPTSRYLARVQGGGALDCMAEWTLFIKPYKCECCGPLREKGEG